MVEDSFKREARRVQVKSNTVSNRETQLHRLLVTRVISGVHHYTEPSMDSIIARANPLPPEAFQSWRNKDSLEGMKDVVGKAQTEWYSPPASALHTPFSDLAFVRIALQRGSLADMDRIWQNCFLNGENLGCSHWVHLAPLQRWVGRRCL